MTESDDELIFVDLDRREEVRRRIEVLDRFLATPTRRSAAAAAAAAELGLGIAQFYVLVRVWKETRRPERLAGAKRSRPKHVDTFTEQQAALLNEVEAAEGDNSSVEAVVLAARQVAADRSIELPRLTALRRRAAAIRHERLRDTPAGSGLLIDHCALDLSVRTREGAATMAVATFVLDLKQRCVLGSALTAGVPGQRTAARAIVDALLTAGTEAKLCDQAPALTLHREADEQWAALIAAMENAGINTMVRKGSLTNGRIAIRILGPVLAGFSLKPGHTSRAPADRHPSGKGGPVHIGDAQRTLRARLQLMASGSSPLLTLAVDSRAALLRELSNIIHD